MKKFLTVIEAYQYPIYGIMFHPEYQILEFTGDEGFELNNNKDTEEIAYKISNFLKQEALNNNH